MKKPLHLTMRNALKLYYKYKRRLSRLASNENLSFVENKKLQFLVKKLETLKDYLTFRANVVKTATVGAAFALTLMTNVSTAQCVFVEQLGTDNPMSTFSPSSQYNSIDIADMDNDGDFDIIAGSQYNSGAFFYYENTGDAFNPVFTEQTGVNNPLDLYGFGNYMSSVAIADIDGDGDFDVLATGYGDGSLSFFENIGDASNPIFAPPTGALLSGYILGNYDKLTFADIDNDGDLDLAVGNDYSDITRFFENTGDANTPTFVELTGAGNPLNGIVLDVGYTYSGPEFHDGDGDGDLDLYLGQSFGGPPNIIMYENTGNASVPVFTSGSSTSFISGIDEWSQPRFADLDGDGDDDFMIAPGQSTLVYRYFKNETDLTVTTTPEGCVTLGTATTSGGSPTSSYVYNWGNGSTIETATGLSAGNYTVDVASSSGVCSNTISYTVTGSGGAAISVSEAVTDIPACTSGSKSISSLVFNWLSTDCNGGIDPIEFLINGNSVYSGLLDPLASCTCDPSSDQSVTITDGAILSSINSGTNTFDVVFSSGSSYISYAQVTVNYSDFSNQNIVILSPQSGAIGDYGFGLCTYGYLSASSSSVDADVENFVPSGVDLTLLNGTPPYTFDWSDDGVGDFDDAEDLITTVTGTYYVTVQDDCGQQFVSSGYQVNQAVASAPTISLNTKNDVLCNGQFDGSISVNVADGCGAKNYSWTGPNSYASTTKNITGLSAGVYNISVSDDFGSATANYTITEPSAINIAITTVTASCSGGDGEAHAVVSGGASGYSYDWYDSNWNYINSGADLYGQDGISLNFQVYDMNNCYAYASPTIPQNNPIVISVTEVMESCTGNDGVLTASATGGSGTGYVISWYDQSLNFISNNATISSLQGGDYTVEVVDDGVCFTSDLKTLGSKKITSSTYANTINCNGDGTGYTEVYVNGGSGNYNYLWSTGGTNSFLSNMDGGINFVTVTDAVYGCTTVTSTEIIEPTAITFSYTMDEPTCNGFNDGVLYGLADGGSPGYSYTWYDNSWNYINNGATLTNQSAQDYNLEIYDNNGCLLSATVTLTEPSAISITAIGTDETCGNKNGTAMATATGGTPNYIYSWNPSGVGSTITGLDGGVYTVFAEDANFCSASTTVSIANTTSLTVTTSVIADASCGSTDGSADVTVVGGATPYSYSWSNGNNTNTLSNVAAGTFAVTVFDANLCEATKSVGISNSGAPTVTLASTSVTCNNGADGSAGVTVTAVSGGVTSTSYQWSNNVFMPSNTGLVAGTYFVTVLDNNGCATIKSVDITEPEIITFDMNVSNASCNGLSDGSIFVNNEAGGNGNYTTYEWSSGETGVTSINSKSAATYIVTISDSNGCVGIGFAPIEEPSLIVVSLVGTETSCFGGSNGSIASTVSGGESPYTYQWDNIAGSVTATVTGIYGNVDYTVTVTDNSGCTSTSTLSVSEQNGFTSSTSSNPETGCGANDGTATVSLTGGSTPFVYNWQNADNTSTSSGLSSGVYTVTVTDADACIVTNSAAVANSAGPQVTIASTGVSCNGDVDGTASASIAGGSTSATYTWSNGATTTGISGLTPGTYNVTVSDGGCADGYGVATIINPAVLTVAMSSTAETAIGLNNGVATATPSGGTAPYSYAWTGSTATSASITAAPASYTVTVTDNNGCTVSGGVSIAAGTVSCSINVTAAGTDITCFGSSNGTATATVTGGNAPITYNWGGGLSGATISNLVVGSYSVQVLDANQCPATSNSVVIAEPTAIVLTIVGTDATSFGGSDGAANITVTGGTGVYTYAWSNSQNSANISGLTAGTYTLNVSDDNSCTTSSSVTISAPSGINEHEAFSVEVYPNPNNGQFVMKLIGNGKYTYVLRNVIGQEIVSNSVSLQGATTENFQFNNAETGVYFLTVVGNGINKTEKIIIK